MTRFARAKGSKASNEKTPEDSTPWEVMKEQMLQARKEESETKKREEFEKLRMENYEKFLKEQKTQKKKAVWCEFDSVSNQSVIQNKKPVKNKFMSEPDDKTNESFEINQNTGKSKKAKKMSKFDTTSLEAHVIGDKKKIILAPNDEQILSDEQQLKSNSKKNKKNKNKLLQKPEYNSEPEVNNINVTKGNINIPKEKVNNAIENNRDKIKKSKKKKVKTSDGPIRRKPINDQSFHLIVNGREVELVRFDGFPVMKKDAERLGELRQNMIKKGIPKSEVQRTMKLERRRAEKALARMKRDVCYNCRKGGHNLSDCPDLKSKIPGVDAAEGVCFKCGSTEHRQFECKVQRDKEFRFATCFICKDQGHIARQCPDNPKGLYPNGGCCKLCGDVTHMRKDCPTVNTKKEESSIKLPTLDSIDNIEDINQGWKMNTSTTESTKKPKKIKF